MFIDIQAEDIKVLIKHYFKDEYKNHIILTYISNLIHTRGSSQNLIKTICGTAPQYRPGDVIKIKVGSRAIGNKSFSELSINLDECTKNNIISDNSIYFRINEIALGCFDYLYRGYIKYIREEKSSDDNSVNLVETITEISITADDIYDYKSVLLANDLFDNNIADRF